VCGLVRVPMPEPRKRRHSQTPCSGDGCRSPGAGSARCPRAGTGTGLQSRWDWRGGRDRRGEREGHQAAEREARGKVSADVILSSLLLEK